MKLVDQNVLFFTRTMKLGGTENVVLQLCEVFKPLVKKIVVCSCGGVNVEILKTMGITHYEIPDIESKSPKTIWEVCRAVKNIVKKENITVIHTHHRMAAFYVAMLGIHKKCYFLNTSHNTFTDKIGFTRFAYKHAKLIACGEMVKKNLVEVFCLPEEQVTVIHNAVKPFLESGTEDDLIKQLHQEGYFVVGNVGRLSEQKGMEYYIRAIPKIIAKCPQTRFVIVGSGEDEEKLRLLAEELSVDQYLHFMGYRTDIQNLMTQIDLVVLSSLWEGLPLTPIEAFSVGKTVVGTAVDGTVEVIDQSNGMLVPPKNATAIADSVIRLFEDEQFRCELEKGAVTTYREKFSFEIHTDRYVEFFSNL